MRRVYRARVGETSGNAEKSNQPRTQRSLCILRSHTKFCHAMPIEISALLDFLSKDVQFLQQFFKFHHSFSVSIRSCKNRSIEGPRVPQIPSSHNFAHKQTVAVNGHSRECGSDRRDWGQNGFTLLEGRVFSFSLISRSV